MKTINKKMLLLIAATAFAAAGIMIAVLMSIQKNETDNKSGFNAEIPDAVAPMMEEKKSKAYESVIADDKHSLSDTTEKKDTAAVETIRQTLDDFRKTSTKSTPENSAETIKHTLNDFHKTSGENSSKTIKHPKSDSYTVHKKTKTDSVNESPVNEEPVKRRGFIGAEKSDHSSGSIEACIHEDQKITDGDRVRIRITEKCRINGVEVDPGTIITGIASFSGNRIKIEVHTIRTAYRIMETRLTVYDSDSAEGIFYPELGSEKAARKTGSNLARHLASTLGSNSVITSTVIDGGSSYLSEKAENISAKLYGNYKITLVEK